MKEQSPECPFHKIPMTKNTIKSQIFDDIICIWKCPYCDYKEYRNDDDE